MAQRGVNKVTIVGNLGQEPELRYTQAQKAVCTISVATSEVWKDKQTGQPQERTEWHRIVFFDKLAEIATEYLRKGSKVYVEGSLRTRKWQGQDGQDRYTTEIMGTEMQMLDSRQDSQNAPERAPAPRQPQRQAAPQNAPQRDSGRRSEYDAPHTNQRSAPATTAGYPQPDYGNFDDDIPF